MRKYVYGALALSAAISPATASENDWLSLDQELEALPTLLNNHEGGPQIGGYIKADYRWSQDTIVPDGEGFRQDDVSDFNVERARIEVLGDLGDTGYSYLLQGEFANSTMNLEGAWVNFPIADGIEGRFGRQRVPFLRSGLVSFSRLFFLDRTFNGQGWSNRTEGITIRGNFDEKLRWYVGGFDSLDTASTDHMFSGRVEFDAMGTGQDSTVPNSLVEGSVGASDDMNLTIAAAFATDTGDVAAGAGGTALALEAIATTSVYSFGAEIVNYSDDDDGAATIQSGAFAAADDARTTFSLWGTFMLAEGDEDGSGGWEAGLRFEDLDDTAETTVLSAGVNHYLLPNHDLKWQFQFRSTMRDADGLDDENQIGVGIVARF